MGSIVIISNTKAISIKK